MRRRDDRTWRLLLMVPAMVVMLVGVAVLGWGLDRGTPSQLMLSGDGCDFARLAGAVLHAEQGSGRCTIRAYMRTGLFSRGAQVDLGQGVVFDLGEGQIVGRKEDASFEAPLGPMQIRYGWIGGGLLLVALMMVFLAIAWPKARMEL